MILAVALLTIGLTNAQSPNKMSYQAVVRNADNVLVQNHPIGMQISILQGSATGTPVYVETQTTSTNANGLVSIKIGEGTVVTGTFSEIDWSIGNYFIKTEIDPQGGTAYTISGTSELTSVPYALFSATGVKGQQGIQGEKGDVGDKGDKGDAGDIGLTGAKGDSGIMGLQGIQGFKGDKGDKGDTGVMGLQGIQGLKGDTGVMGLQGIQGLKGDTGVIGNGIVNSWIKWTGVTSVASALASDDGSNITIQGKASNNYRGGAVNIYGGASCGGTGNVNIYGGTYHYAQGDQTRLPGNVYIYGGSSDYGAASGGNIVLTSGLGSDYRFANGSILLLNGNVGIGTASPGAKLEVSGQVKITGGTPGVGKVLISDASGLASWGSIFTHYIGESYGGGIVFYVYDNGQHGLIAATANQSTGIPWYNGTYRYTGATGSGLGAGAMNTAIIIAVQSGDIQPANFAAKVCADYSVTVSGITYGGWYLPSAYELNLLYLQRAVVGGLVTGSNYLSSTESDLNTVWVQSFYLGSQSTTNKSYLNVMRAIRAF